MQVGARFTPTAIAFANHPSILRGRWTGTVTGQALRLELTATYDTGRQDTVGGTGTLNAEALTVTGTVMGGSLHTSLRAQTSPAPETASLTLLRSGQVDVTLRCYAGGGDTPAATWIWQCFPAGTTPSFNLTRGTP
ncbi:hypothetical protein [Deinococcus sp.]|uniref:hypothetical protein n=1 Tax=Deinococcus sp. TaxID=47478 RepID=UPI002869CD74|nr:hypothetical protein [Deinococcus sp.]